MWVISIKYDLIEKTVSNANAMWMFPEHPWQLRHKFHLNLRREPEKKINYNGGGEKRRGREGIKWMIL